MSSSCLRHDKPIRVWLRNCLSPITGIIAALAQASESAQLRTVEGERKPSIDAEIEAQLVVGCEDED